jgi:hypothetical protein
VFNDLVFECEKLSPCQNPSPTCQGKVSCEGNVCKWCCLFNGVWPDVQSKAQSGHPSVITRDLKDRVDPHVHVGDISLGRP